MKKLFLSILSILLTLFVCAQNTFGLKGGLNFSKTKELGSQDEFLLAPHFGLYSDINLGKKIFLRPEVNYSVKGFIIPPIGLSGKGKATLSYITMPVLLGYRPFKNFSILAGPEAGYLLTVKYRFDDRTIHPDWYNEFDFSLNLGASYSITKRFSTELRYTYGFKDLITVTFTDSNGNELTKEEVGSHRLFQLSFSYQLTDK